MDDGLEEKGLTISESNESADAHIKEGWLVKRGSGVKNNKRRYVILAKGILNYYENKAAEGAEQLQLERKGVVPLINASCVYSRQAYQELVLGLTDERASAEFKQKKSGMLGKLMGGLSLSASESVEEQFGFAVRAQGRVLVLFAENREEMDAWIKAIMRSNVLDLDNLDYPAPSKHGWLVKSTANDEERKLRYCVLNQGALRYFEDATEEDTKVFLSLKDARVGTVKDAGGVNTQKFYVGTASGLWYFQASSGYEAAEWVDAVTSCTEYTSEYKVNILEGFLVKLGHRSDTLTRRWFALLPGTLAYYADESQSALLGQIDLTPETAVEQLPAESQGDKCVFKVITGEKDLVLTATSAAKMDEWITAIRCAGVATL